MLFNSFIFIIFFPIVCILYFVIPQKYRWLFLLVASYYFYMNWQPIYALLLAFSTLITFLTGILIDNANEKKKKKSFLVSNLILNLSILFIFKYFNFINESVFVLLEILHIRWPVPDLNILLPVGISFYTFQAIGYTIDVYRGDIKAERHIGIYALFVSFFPQLVAGPIERAKNLLPQFKERHYFNPSMAVSGLRQMLWGMFMKVVVADRVAVYVDAVYNNYSEHSGSSLLLATVFFAIQIYCDFGGYSLIAIGAAKIMGFRLMMNFKQPYFAYSVTDFWRRWHISLSTWFKDYLYIPLGGNRVSKRRNYFNLFVTFLISGMWHGANWTFLMWGSVHGFYQVLEKGFKLNKQELNSVFWYVRICLTFILVDFAWIFFRSDTIQQAFWIIKKIITDYNGSLFINKPVFLYAVIGITILFIKDCFSEWKLFHKWNYINKYTWIRFSYYIMILSLIMGIGVFDAGQFIYFQF